jgi:hypothetical protein
MSETPHYRFTRDGVAFKNGKFYWFSEEGVLVLKPWPDPRAWTKDANHGWNASRKRADRVFAFYIDNAVYDKPPQLPADLYEFPGDEKNGGAPVYTPLSDEFPDILVLTEAAPPNGDYDAVRNYGQYEKRLAINRFLSSIPEAVRTELRRYSERRWHLLSLFARCPGAMDLSRSNPALLFALASNWAFHKPAVQWSVRAARGLINRKQRVILKWLGFPATESVRRLLAKISPNALTVLRLLWLREHLPDPACLALLKHLPRINDTVLRLVTSRRVRPHLTPRLLLDLCMIEQEKGSILFPPQRTLLYDTLRMCEAVNWERCPVLFRSLEALKALHRDLGWRIAWVLRMRKGVSYKRLPLPPFPGTEWIRPLKTVEAIAREGWEQEHCAASYISRVAEGHQYLYCVLKPLRGTLAISRQAGTRRWYPSQFRQLANAPVPEAIVKSTFEALFASGKAQKQATVG